jgi:hypothetical protein
MTGGVFFLPWVYAMRRTRRMQRARRITANEMSTMESDHRRALNQHADTVSAKASRSCPRWPASASDSGKETQLHERENHV